MFLRDVVKTSFMKTFIENNGFCKEGKHDSLGCDESGKELLKKNCSLYEQYHLCMPNEAELSHGGGGENKQQTKKTQHVPIDNLELYITCLKKAGTIWSYMQLLATSSICYDVVKDRSILCVSHQDRIACLVYLQF